MAMARVAIVGAGLAGLMAARTLQERGLEVSLFDKGRGPGGRASTRRTSLEAFDHGAPCFTVREPWLRAQVQRWQQAQVVAPWPARQVELRGGALTALNPAHPRYVGTPSMSALGKHLAQGLELRASVRVERLDGGDLQLEDGTRARGFDAVLVTAPAPQAIPLVAASAALVERLRSIAVEPCWALMVAFDAPLQLAFDAAWVRAGPLAWIAREASKPGRPVREALTVHAGPAWSRAHLEDPPEAAAAALLALLGEALGMALPSPTHLQAHRWRYAQPAPLGVPFLRDAQRRWLVAGDGLLGGKVEGALESGRAAAEAIVACL